MVRNPTHAEFPIPWKAIERISLREKAAAAIDASPEAAYWNWHNSEPLADVCVDQENVPQGPRYWERMLEAGRQAAADRKEQKIMHNDKVTISTAQLFAMFPDQETARTYLESRLWPHGVRCPICAKGENITTRAGGYYRCNPCKEDFTVRTGTIFERSHVPLHKWLYAMYLLVTARKGISSMQLSKEIGITQKSAWFVLQRLREGLSAS